MGLDRPIDITTDQHKTVLALLSFHLPNTTAWVYGSRVKWTSSPKSDLDLVVFATPEQSGRVSDLREAFEGSNLPFRVDLFVWDEVPEQFRRQTAAEHVVLVEKKEMDSLPMWQRIALGEIVEIFDGPHATPKKAERGPIFLGISNLVSGRVDLAKTEHLSEEDYSRWTRRVTPRSGDVVFSYETRLGEAALIPTDLRCCLGRRMGLLRPKGGKVDSCFLLYAFLGTRFQETLRSRTVHGSTVDRIPLNEMGDFPIDVPRKLEEQRAIAHALCTLDDKIELNRRVNETLEEMARALFKSWFVDFDPVHAKATLKNHPYATPPQGGSDWSVERARSYLETMDPDVAAAFPDSFMDSELGPIPEGWEVVPLAEVIEVNPPRPLRRQEIAPYLDMANMPTKGHTPEAVVDRPYGSGMRFANGDTLIARITPCLENGKTAYVDFLKENQIGWGSTEYIVLRPRSPLPSEFAYCLGRSAGFREFAIQNMTGTSGRQRVPATAISNYGIVIPNGLEVPQVFREAIGPLFSLASQKAEESRTLAALRDTLLPRLVSGELRMGFDGNAGEKQIRLRGSLKMRREVNVSQGSSRLP